MTTFLIVVIALALIFDYINGFHDAANSIATVVSTKVLTPFQAVVWAALFNFVAYFIFKDHGVANTIAKTAKEQYITLEVIFSGLIGAITWNLFTWWRGIPSSSSHTLIGGFAGACSRSSSWLMRAARLSKSVSATISFKSVPICATLSATFSNNSKKTRFFGMKIFRKELSAIELF